MRIILYVYEREVYETYSITIGDEEIEATAEHPFYTMDDGWVAAEDLEVGDEVATADGESETVDDIVRNILEEPVTVYNFAVMDNHNYFVGENKLLVHNTCVKNPKVSETKLEKAIEKHADAVRADAYDGVKEASKYLKEQGVSRERRKEILESFDIGTIKMKTAGENTYGLRFFGGEAKQKGRYLFETFTNLTNRNNLALPNEWNAMRGIKQFKVRNGAMMITGRAAAQTHMGSQYIGGAMQWYVHNLEDLIE